MQQEPDEEESRQTPDESSSFQPAEASGKSSKGDGPGMMAMGGAAMEFGASIALLAVGGWWLDGKLGTEPWLLVIGLAAGFVGGLYNLYRLGKRYF